MGGRQRRTGVESGSSAALIAWVLAAVGTLIILERCATRSRACARRAEDEIEGLDLSMHGEEGYNFEA